MQSIQINRKTPEDPKFIIGDVVTDSDGTFLIVGKESSSKTDLLILPRLLLMGDYKNMQELISLNPKLIKVDKLEFKI